MSSSCRLAIIGSRNFKSQKIFINFLNIFRVIHPKVETIISGGQKGADSFAEQYALKNKIPFIKSDLSKHGHAEIVEECTHVIAFPSRSGKETQNTIESARQNGKKVLVQWID
jgi:hypothetical protein